jgi:four helix bundle protein
MASHDLRQRTFQFACRIVKVCRKLSAGGTVHRQFAHQLIRSGTSIGANFEEAHAAHSRREFACKLSLVLREARETHYWLRLVPASELAERSEIQDVVSEADELVAIFTSTVRKAKPPLAVKSSGDVAT